MSHHKLYVNMVLIAEEKGYFQKCRKNNWFLFQVVPIFNVSVCVRLIKYINTYLSEKHKTNKNLAPEYLDQPLSFRLSTSEMHHLSSTVHPEIQANTHTEVYQLFSVKLQTTQELWRDCIKTQVQYPTKTNWTSSNMKLATIASERRCWDSNVRRSTIVVRVFTWRVGNVLRKSFSSKSGKTNIILGLCRCFEVYLPRLDCVWVTYLSQGERERDVNKKWCNDKDMQYVLDLPCTTMYQQYKASNNSSAINMKHNNGKNQETVMMVTKDMSVLLITIVCMLVRSMCLPSTHGERHM